jgi:hypothetical protein
MPQAAFIKGTILKIMKSLRLAVAILICIPLLLLNLAEASECKKSEDYSFLLCGDWTEPEVEELVSSLLGDEEIHKLIKQSENDYLLHTCESRNMEGACLGGLVYVFERNDGILVVRPEMWNWVF